ncbi:hypothetical protein [Pseudonocardia endophytica]|uniref:MaoC dehydratase-like protein n=1 Tax=Pseudonocardia endophytica TaxID=401976 RepID=A0A4R1HMV9_PSEEN|nr:hypothetical protein [Pseudonocardia endophytica]TCK22501.1 hypothetical protein EV378_6506 [Pseudonocardia endophytica]
MGRLPQEFDDVPFSALEPGRELRTTYHLSAELVAEYDRLVGAERPSETVRPWVFSTFRPMFAGLGGRMEQGSIHTRERVVVHGSVPVGAVLDVVVRVTGATERNGRRHVDLEIAYAHDGTPVCTTSGTYLWGEATR